MEGRPLAGAPIDLPVLPGPRWSSEKLALPVLGAAIAVVWGAEIYILLRHWVFDEFVVGALAVLVCMTISTFLMVHLVSRRRLTSVSVSGEGIKIRMRSDKERVIRWDAPRFHIWVVLGPRRKPSASPSIVWAPMFFAPSTPIGLQSLAALMTRARDEHLEVTEVEYRPGLLDPKLRAVRICRPGLIKSGSSRP